MNIKKDATTITIFSQRLAGYLMLNGFVLADMRPDRNGSGKNVFFFKNSNDIINCINKYNNTH